mmetsp:Transcript_4701/g.3957  ORF Transcript_4701/g.3957 Transcript_4701/m.3957 type:complete len:141 (-) Transcript_4701:538-960(-)
MKFSSSSSRHCSRKASSRKRKSSRKNSERKNIEKKKSERKITKRIKKNRIQVSYDGQYQNLLNDTHYKSSLLQNKYEESALDQLRDEKVKRKVVEDERDNLIKSLNDMSDQALRLEKTLRDFEKENIDLFHLLKQNNTEL